MNTTTAETTESPVEFLYPTSNQFLFDELCSSIVKELEQRNWTVPGISVKFYEYHSRRRKFKMVSSIQSEQFKLWFCRSQGRIAGTRSNNIAAVNELIIPGKELRVYKDESGPRLFVYAGNNWKKDREKFMHGSKVNSKLRGEPRTYLAYSGRCLCEANKQLWGKVLPHTHDGQRAPLLLHTNDLNREYDPVGDEPTQFVTEDIIREFTTWLETNVLAYIMSQPIPEPEQTI